MEFHCEGSRVIRVLGFEALKCGEEGGDQWSVLH